MEYRRRCSLEISGTMNRRSFHILRKIVGRILYIAVFTANFVKFFLRERDLFTLKDLKCIKKVGMGISDTLIVADKYVVKMRNRIKEMVVRTEYIYPYEGFYEYVTGKEKIKREFEILKQLHALNLTPRPLRHGDFYLVMEYLDATVASENLRESCFTVELIVSKIEELHGHGFYHGDLNLNNLLIDNKQNVYFIDFEVCYKAGTPDAIKRSLDYIILIEKIHRFYPEIFRRCGRAVILAVLRRDGVFVEHIRKFGKWLNPEIIKMVELAYDKSTED